MTQRDLANILSGPAKITIGGVDIGHTEGESRLTMKPLFREQKADATGDSLVDLVQVGMDISLTTRVTEWTLAGLQLLFPLGLFGASYLGLGGADTTRLRSQAAQLIMHPLDLDAADTSRDVTFWKAVAASVVAVGFANDLDRVFEVTFRILPDPAQPAKMNFGKIGAV